MRLSGTPTPSATPGPEPPAEPRQQGQTQPRQSKVKSSLPTHSHGHGHGHGYSQYSHRRVAVDPVTLVINECMIISSAMRKLSRWSQSGVAAILGAGQLFGDVEDDMHGLVGGKARTVAHGLSVHSSVGGGGGSGSAGNPSSSSPGGGSSTTTATTTTSTNSTSTSTSNDSPLLSSFFRLRAILTETPNLHEIDSLTLLQPFLLVIKSSSTSGHITQLALSSIHKFLQYQLVTLESCNVQQAVVQIMSSLTHCRFEAGDQNSDDAVLLKVLRLLEVVMESDLLNLLPDEVISEVVQTFLRLACNKKRSEVLRKAAEMSMSLVCWRVFNQLETIAGEVDHHGDQSTVVMESIGTIGTLGEEPLGGVTNEEHRVSEEGGQLAGSNQLDDLTSPLADDGSFGIHSINEFLAILISMISPTNQYQHMESTRVFALSLLNGAIEICGGELPKHPALLRLVSDNACKHILQIMSTLDSPPLLQASLQLFTTITIVLGDHMKSQIELSLTLLFKSVVPKKKEQGSTTTTTPISSTAAASRGGDSSSSITRLALSKEMIIESLSLLWTRSPMFFTQLFMTYDCDFEKSDLAVELLEGLCELSLPESAGETSDNVPPICLEAILGYVGGVNERIREKNRNKNSSEIESNIKSSTTSFKSSTKGSLVDKSQKMAFISCTTFFNTSPKLGVQELYKKGFVSNPSDIDELARFIFSKSTRLNKKVLGEYLAKPSNIDLLKKFIHLFEFEGLRVDEALRILLKSFRLPGESQQIERVVEIFAERYEECQKSTSVKEISNGDSIKISEKDSENSKNSESSDSSDKDSATSNDELEEVHPDKDATFILSYSIIMLNTDQHNPQVQKRMDLESYRRNLRGIYYGKDFPEWYLSKIYYSIRDREIIMPEEHHGTEKWFDDVWNNMISSEVEEEKESRDIQSELDLDLILSFDKVLFKEIVHTIISTLIKVFQEALDDHIITRLMSSVDKCATICMHFGLDESIDDLLTALTLQTSLTENHNVQKLTSSSSPENIRDEIPITQIHIDQKDEVITVSGVAVWFGHDFKAQISAVVLFRLMKKTQYHVSNSVAWKNIVKIIMTLFENCLIDPNLFVDFQTKLKLGPLPKVKPRYVINRSKPLKDLGLLSTFSSFLKGYSDVTPEPTDQEVELTLSTIDCVRSINIPEVFESLARNGGGNLEIFMELLLEQVEEEQEEEEVKKEPTGDTVGKSDSVNSSNNSSSNTSATSLFVFEACVCFSLILGNGQLISKLLTKLSRPSSSPLSKRSSIRISTYKLLLLKEAETLEESLPILEKTLDDLNEIHADTLIKLGGGLCPTLISLANDGWSQSHVLSMDSFWKILRILATQPENSKEIVTLASMVIDTHSEKITPLVYLTFLGLLDEISSLGAMGSHEQQSKNDLKTGVTSSSLIADLKTSISLTTSLTRISTRQEYLKEKDLTYSQFQALAHQCFNPCREVRQYAASCLQLAILADDPHGILTTLGVFEFVLFPLLSELGKEEVLATDPTGFAPTQVETLSLASKVFLHSHGKLPQDDIDSIWLGILDHMVNFQHNGDVNYSKLFKETGLEMLKNMILVLQSNNVLVRDKKEVWEETWARVEVLDSELLTLRDQDEPEPTTTDEQSQTLETPEVSTSTNAAVTATLEEPAGSAE